MDRSSRPWLDSAAIVPVLGLWLALATAAAMGFGTRLLLGRALGAEALGAFATALAAVALLSRGAGFGVHLMWLDVHGAEGPAARRWYRPSAAVVAIAAGTAAAAGAAWAAAALPALTRHVFLLLLPLVALQVVSDLLGARCQIAERHGTLGLVRLAPNAARFLPAAAGFAAAWDILGFARAIAVAGVAGVAVMLVLLLRTLGPPAVAVPPRPSRRAAVHRSWPYALSGLLYLVYFQIDVLLIQALEGEGQTGLYAAAAAVVSFVYLLPGALYGQFLRVRFHRWAAHDRPRLREAHRGGTRRMLGLGVAVGAALALAGPSLLRLGFGGEFSDATPALLVLAVAVPLRFGAASARAVMWTQENIRLMNAIDGGTAVLNVALNLVLIPWLGIAGAAVATVVSEGALLALIVRPAARYVDGAPLPIADGPAD